MNAIKCFAYKIPFDQHKQFAKKNGLKLIAIGGEHSFCDVSIYPKPFEVLSIIKNAAYVVTDALIIGAIASVVLGICFYFTRWIGCISVLCIIIGALTGTWVSFGARKFEIEFEDLASLEKDKMTPVIRLIYIAVASLIFALLMSVGLIDVKIGNVDISKAFTDIKPALVIGVLCGLVESKIGIQVYNKAVSLLVDNSEQ